MLSLSNVKTLLLDNGKLIAGITGVVGLATALYGLYDHVYDSGRESMRVEMTKKHNEEFAKQQKKYEAQIDKSIKRIYADYQSEIERVRNEKEIITKVETVTEYVDREIIVKAECELLASDVISVLKQATNIVSATSQNDKGEVSK